MANDFFRFFLILTESRICDHIRKVYRDTVYHVSRCYAGTEHCSNKTRTEHGSKDEKNAVFGMENMSVYGKLTTYWFRASFDCCQYNNFPLFAWVCECMSISQFSKLKHKEWHKMATDKRTNKTKSGWNIFFIYVRTTNIQFTPCFQL